MQIAEADARLAKEFPDYNALANPKPLSLADTQALLAPDETLISYLIGEKTSYVFAVSRDSLSWKELGIGADELNKAVSSIRLGLNFDEIQRKKASPVKLEALYELYLKILQPVDEFIRPKAKLIVVPDGALTSLPFQLLVTEPPRGRSYRGAAYLVRRHAITVSPSVTSLKVLRQSASLAPADKPMTGFGDPLFDRNKPPEPGTREPPARAPQMRSFVSYFRGSKPDIEKLRTGLVPLPNTARELKSVAAALAVPSEIKLGVDATKPAVKSALRRRQYRAHVAGALAVNLVQRLFYSFPTPHHTIMPSTIIDLYKFRISLMSLVCHGCTPATCRLLGARLFSRPMLSASTIKVSPVSTHIQHHIQIAWPHKHNVAAQVSRAQATWAPQSSSRIQMPASTGSVFVAEPVCVCQLPLPCR